METIEIFEKLGLVLGSITIFAIAGVFVLRRVLELLINRDLERFKSELGKESASHKIRYERLHSERMEVIKNTYQKLSRTNKSVQSVMGSFWLDPSDNAKLERMMNSIEEDTNNKLGIKKIMKVAENVFDLKDYFEDNRIFFDEDIAIEMDSLIEDLSELWDEHQLVEDVKYDNPKVSLQVWRENWECLEIKILKTKSRLEVKFRAIIGIES